MHVIIDEGRKLVGDVISVLGSRQKQKALLKTPLYANAIYFMLASITNGIFGFIFWIIAARFYKTDDVGLASAIISAGALLATFSDFGFSFAFLRFLPQSQKQVKLINTGFTIAALLGLATAGVFLAGLSLWSPRLAFIGQNPVYLTIFLVFVPVTTLSGLADQSFMAGRRASFTLTRAIIFNILRVILPIAMAIYFGSFGIFGSWTAAAIVSTAVAIFWLLPRVYTGYRALPALDVKVIRDTIPYSFVNHLSNLLWSASGFILPIMVLNQLSAKDNAFFAMAWAMSTILTMIPSSTANSLLAEGAHNEESLRQHTRQSLKLTFLLLVPAVILLLLLADKFLLLYGGAYSQNGATVLRWLCLAALPLGLNSLYFSVKRVQKKLKPVIFFTALTTVISLTLAVLLMPSMGTDGAAIAWLAGQGVTAVILVIGYISGKLW